MLGWKELIKDWDIQNVVKHCNTNLLQSYPPNEVGQIPVNIDIQYYVMLCYKWMPLNLISKFDKLTKNKL